MRRFLRDPLIEKIPSGNLNEYTEGSMSLLVKLPDSLPQPMDLAQHVQSIRFLGVITKADKVWVMGCRGLDNLVFKVANELDLV